MLAVILGGIKLLQSYLPFQVNVLKYMQYLHHEKRNTLESTNGICNFAIQVVKVVKNHPLNMVF